MGSKASKLPLETDLQAIAEETGFSRSQIMRLYSRYTSLDKQDHGELVRQDFLRIPELAINPLGDRIVHSFFESQSETVNFPQFMRTLARFRPITEKGVNKLNSREEKLKFAFGMYDLDQDGKITRDELLAVLHMMVGSNISEDQLGSIADRTRTEADLNGDHTISFEEFCKAMEKVDVEQKMSIRFLN